MSSLAAGLAFAAQTAPLLGTDLMLLRRDARHAASEQVCLVHDIQKAKLWFNRKYGKRLERVDIWSRGRFAGDALDSAMRAVERDGIEIGGCHLDIVGRSINLSELEFSSRLRELEHRIAAQTRDAQ